MEAGTHQYVFTVSDQLVGKIQGSESLRERVPFMKTRRNQRAQFFQSRIARADIFPRIRLGPVARMERNHRVFLILVQLC